VANVASAQGESMKLRLRVEDAVLTATLVNNKTSRDLASLLPLTLTMNDLFRREKYGHPPRAISGEARRSHSFEVGGIGYWSPCHDLAVFYRQDGEAIPTAGIIVVAKLDSGVEPFDVPGSMKVRIDLLE
jgi:hypothetical protein